MASLLGDVAMSALGVEDGPLSPGLVPYPPLLQNPRCLRRQSRDSGLSSPTPKKLRTFQASTLPLRHTPKPLKIFDFEVVPDCIAQAGSSCCGSLSVGIPGMCHDSQPQSAFNLSDTLKSKADNI